MYAKLSEGLAFKSGSSHSSSALRFQIRADEADLSEGRVNPASQDKRTQPHAHSHPDKAEQSVFRENPCSPRKTCKLQTYEGLREHVTLSR